MPVYLDNAATTSLDPEVISVMHEFMKLHYGNPSSVHTKGREARVEIEKVRKKIASIFNCKDKEIIFTSGGTEANNAVLKSIALSNKVERIISSPIEHHSILDTLDWIKKNTSVDILFLDVDAQGNVNLEQLDALLSQNAPSLVSLMQANNEIGNLLDLNIVGNLCRNKNALFHTDMVQTFGHLPVDLSEFPIDFATGSAHKVHGPKGVGFIYVNSDITKLPSFLHGGAQERSIRAGTENGIGIIGMGKAFEIANHNIYETNQHFTLLKKHTVSKLKQIAPSIAFNGHSANLELSLPNIINVKLPGEYDDTLLFNLDLQGIYVSEGSACSSGASEGSHIINTISKGEPNCNNLRLSLSKYSTIKELDFAINAIGQFCTTPGL